jgi:hypothetical protein
MLRVIRDLCVSLAVFSAMMLLTTNDAHAVATAQVNVTGQAIGETTLQLLDDQGQAVQEDEDSDPRAGIWWWRDASAGSYTLVIRQPGKADVRQPITLRDGSENVFRVDSATRTVASGRQPSALATTPRFGIGLLGGAKRMPYDDLDFSSSALGIDDGDGLDRGFPMAGIEGRYYLDACESLQGMGLFLAASYLHYFGDRDSRRFIDAHPTPGLDSGGLLRERWAMRLAVGRMFNLSERLLMSVLAGAHATRVSIEAFSDESGGGGPYNRFSRKRTVVGPYAAIELGIPIAFAFAQSSAVQLFVRGEAQWMRDVSVSGESAFGFDYRTEVDGGLQYGGLMGIELRY